MDANDKAIVAELAQRHHASTGSVQAALDALRSSGGKMAQFSHQDFGGMAQWSNGMTMVGDMFNAEMKAKLNAICNDLVAYLARSPDRNSFDASNKGDRDRGGQLSIAVKFAQLMVAYRSWNAELNWRTEQYALRSFLVIAPISNQRWRHCSSV